MRGATGKGRKKSGCTALPSVQSSRRASGGIMSCSDRRGVWRLPLGTCPCPTGEGLPRGVPQPPGEPCPYISQSTALGPGCRAAVFRQPRLPWQMRSADSEVFLWEKALTELAMQTSFSWLINACGTAQDKALLHAAGRGLALRVCLHPSAGNWDGEEKKKKIVLWMLLIA